MVGEKAFLATSGVTGKFYVTKGPDDKAEIVKSQEGLGDARVVSPSISAGDRIEKGALMPCIEKALVKRGVLVEKEVKKGETLADISGDNEGGTDVEVTPMRESAKGKGS